MSEVIEQFEFNLTKPLDYSGSDTDCQVLTCHAPKGTHLPMVAKLKSIFVSSALAAQKNLQKTEPKVLNEAEKAEKAEEARKQKDATGREMVAAIYMSSEPGVVERFFKTANLLLTTVGICTHENGQNVKEGFLDRMSCNDLEGLIGDYMKIFLLNGLMD